MKTFLNLANALETLLQDLLSCDLITILKILAQFMEVANFKTFLFHMFLNI